MPRNAAKSLHILWVGKERRCQRERGGERGRGRERQGGVAGRSEWICIAASAPHFFYFLFFFPPLLLCVSVCVRVWALGRQTFGQLLGHRSPRPLACPPARCSEKASLLASTTHARVLQILNVPTLSKHMLNSISKCVCVCLVDRVSECTPVIGCAVPSAAGVYFVFMSACRLVLFGTDVFPTVCVY